jgi:hypothetical protein
VFDIGRRDHDRRGRNLGDLESAKGERASGRGDQSDGCRGQPLDECPGVGNRHDAVDRRELEVEEAGPCLRIVSSARTPWPVAMIARASRSCSSAKAVHTRSTTAVESTSVPSMSNSTARHERVTVVAAVTYWP